MIRDGICEEEIICSIFRDSDILVRKMGIHFFIYLVPVLSS